MRESKLSDELILVDARNRVEGHASRARCHAGQGLRHRAFSVFLFNARGEVLLQRRSRSKRLWPAYWSNSCCSHPRRGESVTSAARRRLHEELGIRTGVKLVFRFEYQASYRAVGSEHEVCAVLLARSDAEVRPNAEEVAEWRYVAPEELDRRLLRAPGAHTPWMRLEWLRLRNGHWPAVRSYLDAH